MDIAPITATIPTFCRLAGIGRSKVYEMLADGTLESVYLGGRRLIVIDSWRRLVDAAPRQIEPVTALRRAAKASGLDRDAQSDAR